MAKVPAYFTAAFGLDGVLTIQQIQYREVVEVEGELLEVKQYPPDLITAPQVNDQITATIADAVGAIAAGHLEAVRQATAERDEAVVRFEAVNGANIEHLRAELVAKDAIIQGLLTEKEVQ
jgi:hypothetical protein